MLLDLVKSRYSARVWDHKTIENDKVDYILECALSAPSKQSIYPWKLFVLGNSKQARKFKDWLFWHDTWCVAGGCNSNTVPSNKNMRFNGQYRAPLLLLWARREIKNLVHTPVIDEHQHLYDATVSASFAMLAAEEQGLRTCFGSCHSHEYTNTILDNEPVEVSLALGIGYATEAKPKDNMLKEVKTKKGVFKGYDTNNLSQSYPIDKHNVRQNKPASNNLIKLI